MEKFTTKIWREKVERVGERKLAMTHGIFEISHVLGGDYYYLKDTLTGTEMPFESFGGMRNALNKILNL